MKKYVVQTKLKGNYRNFFIRSQKGEGIHLRPVQRALSQLAETFEDGKIHGNELKKSLQHVLNLLEMKGLREQEPLRLAVEVDATGDVVSVGRMIG